MSADAAGVGKALAASAPEALRLWRSARRHARPGTFPGLLDGLVEGFAHAVGETFAAGREPEAVWSALEGVLRALPDGTPDELEAEWVLAGEVVSAIADALKAGPDARHHAIGAAREAYRLSTELTRSKGPWRGKLLVVRVLANGKPPRK